MNKAIENPQLDCDVAPHQAMAQDKHVCGICEDGMRKKFTCDSCGDIVCFECIVIRTEPKSEPKCALCVQEEQE